MSVYRTIGPTLVLASDRDFCSSKHLKNSVYLQFFSENRVVETMMNQRGLK